MKEEYILYINFHWGEYQFAITRDKLVHCDSFHNWSYFANVIQILSQIKEQIHSKKYTRVYVKELVKIYCTQMKVILQQFSLR